MARAKKTVAKKEAKVESISSDASTSEVIKSENIQIKFSSRESKYTPKKTKRSMSKKAGLVLPVLQILKKLKEGNYADKVQKGAGVYCAAAVEYLVAEVLELAGNAAIECQKKRITPRHITLAIRNDEELNKLLNGVTVAQGGVLPNIHSVLLPKKTNLKDVKEGYC